jgi:alpha-L-arabinofuranosidase
MNDRNTFANPECVAPKTFTSFTQSESHALLQVPPKSVLVLQLE